MIWLHSFKPPKLRPELWLTAWKYWSPSRGPLKPYSTACDSLGYPGLSLARLQGSGPSLNITTHHSFPCSHWNNNVRPHVHVDFGGHENHDQLFCYLIRGLRSRCSFVNAKAHSIFAQWTQAFASTHWRYISIKTSPLKHVKSSNSSKRQSPLFLRQKLSVSGGGRHRKVTARDVCRKWKSSTLLRRDYFIAI
jgi:hypothetical protein